MVTSFDIGLESLRVGIVLNNFTINILSQTLSLLMNFKADEPIQSIRNRGNLFIANDQYGKGIFLDEITCKKVDFYVLEKQGHDVYGITDCLFKTHFNELNKKEWSSIYSSLIFSLNKNFFFTRSKSRKSGDSINCLDKESGELRWRFNLETLESLKPIKIEKFIGYYNGTLWTALGEHRLIGIDVVKGILIHDLYSIPSFDSDWLPSAIPAPEAMQIHQQRGKLVGLMWEFYWEIDPENGEIDFHDLTDYFKSENIRNDRADFVLGKDHIYFISRHESKLGALNIDTKRLDWVHIFAKNENGVIPEIMELKGNDHILGALDRGGTLHVFEREV